MKIQESPEDMPAGQTPHTTVVYAHNDLVDKVQPGDRVNITGKRGSSGWFRPVLSFSYSVEEEWGQFLDTTAFWDVLPCTMNQPLVAK